MLIVGASLAGTRTALGLRQQGFKGPIRLIGDEVAAPYDRPPLSKDFLAGDIQVDGLLLNTVETYQEQDIQFEAGVRATQLDLSRSTVQVADGRTLTFEKLVVATGSRCIRAPWFKDLPGLYELRTLDDAQRLSQALRTAKSLVIVGAGFIGTEVAATARKLGLDVTMVMRGAAPLEPLGPVVGAAVGELHQSNGVNIIPNVDVLDVVGDAAAEGIMLADSRIIKADLVLSAIGTVPNVTWLEGSSLYDRHGVTVDENQRAQENVWAVGDVVRGSTGHWATAITQAQVAARSIMGSPQQNGSITMPDYFWSDQYKHKLQVLGHVSPENQLHDLDGELDSMKYIGAFTNNDQVSGVLLLNQAKALGPMRQLLMKQSTLEEFQEKFSPALQ